MLPERDVETLLNRAFAKRDKAEREKHYETREWWDGYRTALQMVLADQLPQAIQDEEVAQTAGRHGPGWGCGANGAG